MAFEIEWWDIDRPKDYPKNARKWSKNAIAKVGASIKEFSWRQPIVVDSEGVIVIGHLRRAGGRSVGETTCPVHVARDLSAAKIKALRLADNRLSEESAWDVDLLAAEFVELKALDFDLKITGFDSREIDQFTLQANPAEDDVPPVPEAPVTQAGDLWLLGEHRLLCGDALKPEDVARLLVGVKPIMAFCDPPYGIKIVRADATGADKPFGKNGFDSVVKAGVYAPILGDETIETAVRGFEVCRQIGVKTILFWGANYYAHRLPPSGCWVVWDKQTDGNFGDGEIAYCTAKRSVQIFRHKWSGMLKESEKAERRVHPTQKPVALARWAIGEFLSKIGTVLDLFGGSGSTLIACEEVGRACRMMELAPAYCDVIVTRWQNLTGKEATLDGHGATFEHVKQGRRQQGEDAIMEEAHEARA